MGGAVAWGRRGIMAHLRPPGADRCPGILSAHQSGPLSFACGFRRSLTVGPVVTVLRCLLVPGARPRANGDSGGELRGWLLSVKRPHGAARPLVQRRGPGV